MRAITREQLERLRDRFLPDRPGPLIGLHFLHTGIGAAWVDRFPDPRAILVETTGNWSLSGDADAVAPTALRELVSGFVEAPERFAAPLRDAFPDLAEWRRVVFGPPRRPPGLASPPGITLRRLGPADAEALAGLSEAIAWIASTWGGGAGLAASGTAWGAFVSERLAAVSCPFFVGERYEDIGVVTEPGFRGRGLSTACAGAVCEDVVRRGRRPCWSTSPDNVASLRVAEKLGFVPDRHDVLYVVRVPVPQP